MSKEIDKNKRLLTEQETAKRLGIHPKTLARHRREGTAPPHIKRGRRHFYKDTGWRIALPITTDDAIGQGWGRIGYTCRDELRLTYQALSNTIRKWQDLYDRGGTDRLWVVDKAIAAGRKALARRRALAKR